MDSGAIAACRIQRCLRSDGPRSDVGLPVESEITLTNRDRGKEGEYRVLAVKKSGKRQPSNTVMAVL
jgi:hypothetical protein